MLDVRRRQPRTRVSHANEHTARLGFSAADQQFARALVDAAHCLDGIDDQVEDHLLQLDTISLNERQALGQLSFHRNAILDRFSTGQRDDLEYCLVDPQQILSRRCFLGEPADAVDDVTGTVTVSQDATERCRTSSKSGGRAPSQRRAAWALVTVAAMGWFTSWAIEADS